MVDLHVHSTRSDGTYSPTELVDYAIEKKLTAFALTDHDSVDGLAEAVSYAKLLREKSARSTQSVPACPNLPVQNSPDYKLPGHTHSDCPDASISAADIVPEIIPEIIPGIELSTEYHGRDVHIVGLFIDYKNREFLDYLNHFVEAREERNRQMCDLLSAVGVPLRYEELLSAYPDSVITRAHFCRFMVEHGLVKSREEAFDRYIGDHAPCFVPRDMVTPAQAVELILKADGIPILAHPILYGMSENRLEQLIAELKEIGLMGIEALYSTYTPADERQIRRLAAKYNLLISGGSDFHGANKPDIDLGTGRGKLYIPDSVLEDLRATRKNLLFTDMDGTLLLNDSTVSDTMRNALDRMTAAGHHLILSSGRPLPSILEVREKERISYPNMLILSNNGALVYDCDRDEAIYENRIAQEDIAYIIARAEASGLHIHGYTAKEIVCHGMNAELSFYTSRIHMPLKCVDDIAAALPLGSFKLQCIHLSDKSKLEAFRESLLDYCGDRIQMIFSNEQYLEILPANAGKGNALRFIADFLHAPLSHTFAAGDAENDISMLLAAGTGIAMANAQEAVKKAADIITQKSNDENGLLEILNRFFR